jgi:hypothetical protein
MYARRHMGGWFSVIMKSALPWSQTAIHSAEGYATGGPAGAIAAGAAEVDKEVQSDNAYDKAKKAAQKAGASGTSGTSGPNFFDTLSNQQLALYGVGGAAVLLLLLGRQR